MALFRRRSVLRIDFPQEIIVDPVELAIRNLNRLSFQQQVEFQRVCFTEHHWDALLQMAAVAERRDQFNQYLQIFELAIERLAQDNPEHAKAKFNHLIAKNLGIDECHKKQINNVLIHGKDLVTWNARMAKSYYRWNREKWLPRRPSTFNGTHTLTARP